MLVFPSFLSQTPVPQRDRVLTKCWAHFRLGLFFEGLPISIFTNTHFTLFYQPNPCTLRRSCISTSAVAWDPSSVVIWCAVCPMPYEALLLDLRSITSCVCVCSTWCQRLLTPSKYWNCSAASSTRARRTGTKSRLVLSATQCASPISQWLRAANYKKEIPLVGSTPDRSTRICFFRVCLCHFLEQYVILIHSPGLKYTITFISRSFL